MNKEDIKSTLESRLHIFYPDAEVTVEKNGNHMGLIVYHEPTLTHMVTWINLDEDNHPSDEESWNKIIQTTLDEWIEAIDKKST